MYTRTESRLFFKTHNCSIDRLSTIIHFVKVRPLNFILNFFFQFRSFSFSPFSVDQPAHRCNIPEGALVNESVPMEMQYGYPAPSQCSMYVNFSISNDTMPCNDGWWYDPASGYDETIVSSVGTVSNIMQVNFLVLVFTFHVTFTCYPGSLLQWDLVCSRAWLAELMMSISTIGTILGTLFFTKLSDAIGRKPVFVACTWSYVVVGVIHALSPSYIFFTIVGVLEGFFQQVKIYKTLCLLAISLRLS